MNNSHRSKLDKLKVLSGASFDKQYVSDQQSARQGCRRSVRAICQRRRAPRSKGLGGQDPPQRFVTTRKWQISCRNRNTLFSVWSLKEAPISRRLAKSSPAGRLATAFAKGSGAAQHFVGGFITYTEEAKTFLLNVPPEMLPEETAVSANVAAAMTSGAAVRLDIACDQHRCR